MGLFLRHCFAGGYGNENSKLKMFQLKKNYNLKLKKKELVTSVRGNLGGYKLSRDPNKIYLSSVIEAVNEDIKTTKCKLKSKKGCTGKTTKCVTHNLWDGLSKHINNYFTSVTLLDVLENKIPRNVPFENSINQSQGMNR